MSSEYPTAKVIFPEFLSGDTEKFLSITSGDRVYCGTFHSYESNDAGEWIILKSYSAPTAGSGSSGVIAVSAIGIDSIEIFDRNPDDEWRKLLRDLAKENS